MQRLSVLVVLSVILGLSIASTTHAYTLEKIGLDPARQDFVVGPGKEEVKLNPGESKTVNILVSNRTGKDQVFSIEVEDFSGSTDPKIPVVLLGADRGPYSLKDYLHFENPTFKLPNGTRAIVPVTVTIPADAEAGGYYGSVLFSVTRQRDPNSDAGAPVVSRVGSLFFVTVNGPVKTEGQLETFDTIGSKRIFISTGKIPVQLLFANTGAIHLTPYGTITVNNILGEQVEQVIVDPWFVMPGSKRVREFDLTNQVRLGRYTLTAEINRGYNDQVDTQSVTIWVLPWKLILGGTLLALVFIWLVRNFRFTRRGGPSERSASLQKPFSRKPAARQSRTTK